MIHTHTPYRSKNIDEAMLNDEYLVTMSNHPVSFFYTLQEIIDECVLLSALDWHLMHAMQVCREGKKIQVSREHTDTIEKQCGKHDS